MIAKERGRLDGGVANVARAGERFRSSAGEELPICSSVFVSRSRIASSVCHALPPGA
jgi:hypothetical protein